MDNNDYIGQLADEANKANAALERVAALIELADSNPNYKLAVIDTRLPSTSLYWHEYAHGAHRFHEFDGYGVVKMEGE